MGNDRDGYGHGHVLVDFNGVRFRNVVRHWVLDRVRDRVWNSDGHGPRHLDGIRAIDRHGVWARYADWDGSGHGHGNGMGHGHGYVTGYWHGVRLRYRHGYDLLRLGHFDRYPMAGVGGVIVSGQTVTVQATGVLG